MGNLDRRLRSLEATARLPVDGDGDVACDMSALTVEQRRLASQAQAEWERLTSLNRDCDLSGFVATLPEETKRAIARIKIVGEWWQPCPSKGT